MRWPWQKKPSGSEAEQASPRQRWDRTPQGLDAITGIKPQVRQSDEDTPGEVYPDEIDPAWAERPDEASGEADRAEDPSNGDPPG